MGVGLWVDMCLLMFIMRMNYFLYVKRFLFLFETQLYNTISDTPDVILMVIGHNMNVDQHAKCADLWKNLEYGPNIPEWLPQWPDGSMILLLDKEEIEVPSRKRSVLHDDSCRLDSFKLRISL